MKKILIIADYYLPGYKGGGPIRTLANIVEWLGDEFEFYILTRDRDLGDEQPYTRISYGDWIAVGKAEVRYLAPEELKLSRWKRLLNTLDYDLIYLNSVFATISPQIMFLRYLRQIPRKPVLIAPRGEFYPGALALKVRKKRAYLFIARWLSLYKDVIWHASTEEESSTIRNIFPGQYLVAPDLTSAAPSISRSISRPLRLIFLSRIARKKNLDFALRLLKDVTDDVLFDIYGPLEDRTYWEECQRLMTALPPNVTAAYKGEILPDQIILTFADYHLFLFPTHGENFGHVIWEALAAGCLVLTSDQTPWHDLETQQIGWTISLDNPEKYLEVLHELQQMDEDAYQQRSLAARQYAERIARDEATLEANRHLFRTALGE